MLGGKIHASVRKHLLQMFESKIGRKMLFAIDLSSKGGSSIGGSFRVKRVCMDSKVIKSFCAEYPLFAPPKVCICYDNFFCLFIYFLPVVIVLQFLVECD
jgi:hypothetical protein